MEPHLSVQQWVSLSQEIRLKLVKIFEIPRSSATHVNNGVLETDGHTYNDLKAITTEKMNNYLGGPIELDYFTLFNAVVIKAQEPEPESVELSPYLQQEQRIEAWRTIIEGIKSEAETKGLLVEFKKLINNYGTIQKRNESPAPRGKKAKSTS